MQKLLQFGFVILTLLSMQISVFAHDDHASMEQFNEDVSVSVVDCTLTDGTETTCYQIESMALPAFEIGPMCPETLEDIGGIWVWDGDDAGLYTLNEAFFLMVAAQGFIFFDDDGNINIVTEVGGPGSGGEPITGNNCFAQTPDETVTMTSLIPTEPIMADTPTNLGTVAQVGIGIDGVPIFADAPSVLDTGNLPALDVCGGHVDPGGWYHWHATAGDIESSFDHEGLEGVDCLYEQSTSALFAYAFDGYLIYGSTEPDGSLPEDLDECGGHLGPTPDSEEDVYHYHAGLEFPNLPNCLVGVVARNNFSTTATNGVGANGGRPGNGNGGQGQNRPNLAMAAAALNVTEQELRDALGQPPNFEAAAEQLGITVEELQDALDTNDG